MTLSSGILFYLGKLFECLHNGSGNKSFKLIYVGAFADSGKMEAVESDADSSSEVMNFLEGSGICQQSYKGYG